jgi:hypothetical protein
MNQYEEDLLIYLQSLSKIEELITSFKNIINIDVILLEKILNIKTSCINNILEYNLIKLITKQQNEQEQQNDQDNIEKSQENEQEKSQENEQENEQENIENQVSQLTNLLGGEQEVCMNNFDPTIFDTFGKGITSLFKIQSNENQKPSIQIKSENNKNIENNNLTFQIKKK